MKKVAVVMIIMITKIRMMVAITEKNSNSYNDNNRATQFTIKIEAIRYKKH